MADKGIKITKTNKKNNKLVVIVSTKVSGKAVKRNKIKRRIKNIVKNYPEDSLRGCKIITSPAVLNLSYQELEKEIREKMNHII